MSWETINLADVKIDKPAPVAVGKYVFTLQPGAGYRTNPNNNIEELNVRFDVTEGQFSGRPVFVSYPDPSTVGKEKIAADGTVTPGKPYTWSAQALKKLEIALGQDSLPGEDPATWLNRIAMNGNARIVADILPGKSYVKDGVTKTEDPKFGIFTVGPAA